MAKGKSAAPTTGNSSTATVEPTTAQTGVTPNPMASNTQDFSDSDDEILDNFADGPDGPAGAGPNNDDGIPLGLGGDKGRQSEPASSTLEADIVSGRTKQAGEKLPPEDPANAPQPVQAGDSEKGAETSPAPDATEPEGPEFSPILLQMAGYSNVAAAKADGLTTPEALHAFIRGRGQTLSPVAPTASPSSEGLYRRSPQPTSVSPGLAQSPEKTPEATREPSQQQRFQLSQEKLDLLDEDTASLLREMHENSQKEIESLRAELQQRDAMLASQQEQDEEARFDQAVQNLGKDWRDVFGEGGGAELYHAGERGDVMANANFNQRSHLFAAVQAVRDINARQGYKPMSLDQEIQWALMQRYPDKFQQVISGGSTSSSNRMSGATASRPTQRRSPPKTKDDESLASVDAMLRKRHGYALDMGNPEEEYEGDI